MDKKITDTPVPTSDAEYRRLAVRVFADFSGTIAIPAVLAALIGKWLDGRYGTSPRYLAVCLVVALILTAAMVGRKAKYYGKKYQELNQA